MKRWTETFSHGSRTKHPNARFPARPGTTTDQSILAGSFSSMYTRLYLSQLADSCFWCAVNKCCVRRAKKDSFGEFYLLWYEVFD
ncbi:hypothetical protein KIN20_028687 [Parelaphostrongylus tenuis]|uniref:Uncharacterized protein n=1 Tax=Parelaphostrongylus tenuis TaxID=148309 RepID=A0AAD5WEW5_PARTN|nr:hypothetical protein KIN20_028687 [Parelaphostrongylus tenuis]